MENIIRRKMKELEPKVRGTYPNRNQISSTLSIEENLTSPMMHNYKYDMIISLGKSVVCGEEEIAFMKNYVIKEVIYELYGEIYKNLLTLRSNIYNADSPENLRLLDELLEYVRP
jgi:hypothetical protein